MSDYISKSALIDVIVNTPSVDIPRCASALFRNGYYNGKAEKQHEIIDIIENQPTLSETEIIRKAFERVVERLEESYTQWSDVYSSDCDRGFNNRSAMGMIAGVLEAIEIVKEECGISE